MYTFFTALLALYSTTASAAYIGRPWDAREAVPAYQRSERAPTSHQTQRVGSVYPAHRRNDALTLRPIRARGFDSMYGIHRRTASDENLMAPAKHANMMWGAPAGTGKLALANMTLHASDDLPVVMLEEFDHLTSSVDCKGDEGQMSLKFKSESAYNTAVKKWSYLNDSPEKQFLAVANHAGCGPVGQRKPYKVSNIDVDKERLTTHLAASPASWKQVAGAFDMNFGKSELDAAAHQRLQTRDFLGFLGDALDGIKDGINALTGGSGNFSKTVDLPVSIGKPNDPHLLFEDFTTNPPKLKLTCTSCFAQGKFEATGSVAVSNFKPKSLQVNVHPKNLHAEVKMQAEIARKNDDHKFTSFEKTLFEAPIPDAGIDIPEVFSLGAKVQFNIQAKALLIGQATINVGGKTSVPDSAQITADLINFGNSGASGFDNITVDPILDLGKASLTANLLAGPQPAVVLGATVLDDNGVEGTLGFGTPTLNLNATAGFDQNGFCKPGDSVTSGFKVQSAANFDMTFSVTAKAGSEDKSLFDRKLVNIPLATFLNKCIPVAGLTPLNKEAPNHINGTNSTGTSAKFRRYLIE